VVAVPSVSSVPSDEVAPEVSLSDPVLVSVVESVAVVVVPVVVAVDVPDDVPAVVVVTPGAKVVVVVSVPDGT